MKPFPIFRLTQIACINENSIVKFEYPSDAMIKIELLNGMLHTLVGFENSQADGEGLSFNFILSNGARSN